MLLVNINEMKFKIIVFFIICIQPYARKILLLGFWRAEYLQKRARGFWHSLLGLKKFKQLKNCKVKQFGSNLFIFNRIFPN